MVTSRNSGTSYGNTLGLQNGCLALAHANLFIQSTLNGNCFDRSGGINTEMLENKLFILVACEGEEKRLLK